MDKNGQEFGIRFATPKDAKNVSSMFREIYNYNYINPTVYDIELLKNKEKIIKELRLEISQKNEKIDDLQTTQKSKLEKTIKENTLEIKRLKELIGEFQEIIHPPSLTQEDIERSLSIFITEDED